MENVVLVGFPGSGKTTIGQAVATILNLEFIDLDRAIEERYHATIPHIFEKYGEFVFRQCENKVLQETLQKTNVLVATGGGAPCFPNAMDHINEHSLSIYIKMTEEALCQRIKHSRKKRPLTDDLDDEKLISYVHQTLEERKTFYEKAKMQIDGEHVNAEKFAMLIARKTNTIIR